MDTVDMEARCTALRHELKAWEKTFALENEGRKAARDDIKANASISQKYKEYNKLRQCLSGNAAPQTPSKRPSKHKSALTKDTEKMPIAPPRSLDVTPAKRKRDSGVDFLEPEPPATELFSPRGPSMIGPTPQRDGIVLGLFDLLPAETPSKRRAVLGEVQPNVLATPSKYDGKAESQASIESRAKWEKTPQSSSKRFMLDQFVTPQKMKRGEQGTPRSSIKGFTTPTFLRRNTALDVVDEDHELTPRPAPWMRKGLGRSLSSMIQTLKKQEEDRLDEEAEIMRELEMEAEGIPMPKKQKLPDILVQDSQAQVTLDVDGFLPSEEEDEEEEAQNDQSQPRRVWKKRGQKRQTRRSNMRPQPKPKPLPVLKVTDNPSGHEDGMAESQVNPDQVDDQNSCNDDDGSDYGTDDSQPSKKRRTQHKKQNTANTTSSTDKKAAEGPIKQAARKVKATAHANYRRLKIKSKGGNGGKGRFGRR